MSFIELVDSIESSLGFPVQRFRELCSTRVTRVYELARGRVDSRGFAGRADVQGFSRWLAQGLFLGSRSFLDSVGGSSKVAYGRDLKTAGVRLRFSALSRRFPFELIQDSFCPLASRRSRLLENGRGVVTCWPQANM